MYENRDKIRQLYIDKPVLYGLEVFKLEIGNYYIFLEVCDILDRENKYIRVRELETYEAYTKDGLEHGVMISLNNARTGFKIKEDTVLDKNEFHYIKDKKTFKIPVEIRAGSKVYYIAQSENNKTLPPGVYYAELIGNGTNDDFYTLANTIFIKRFIPGDCSHWA